MKIIEALKELKLIIKKIEKNADNITQYSSLVSTERPVFGSETDQKNEVSSLIQANKDLMVRYIDLKIRIDRTNMETKVTMRAMARCIPLLSC